MKLVIEYELKNVSGRWYEGDPSDISDAEWIEMISDNLYPMPHEDEFGKVTVRLER